MKTAADMAYDIICAKILNGELAPGTKLSRRKMAKLTGVSMIPVIEALHRLENEGLVESFPYFGSQVIHLTDEVIQDRGSLREAVECEVARILALHITQEQAHQLRFLAAELDQTPRTQGELFWERHYRFHLTLSKMTGRPSLERALHRINLLNILERATSTQKLTGVPIPEDLHMRVVDGIMTRDADRAERIMRDHIHFSGLIRE
jgi:DNA-binding GntR family transcriptional regulator